MFRTRFNPKHIERVLESGSFHSDNAEMHRGTMSADIGVFHLLTNQEGNLHCVHMYVYRLRRGRDVVGSIVPLEIKPPPTHPTCQTWSLGPEKILGGVECCLGVFHPLCEGAEQGTNIADIAPKRCRRWRCQGWVVRTSCQGWLVRTEAHSPVELGTCPSRFTSLYKVTP